MYSHGQVAQKTKKSRVTITVGSTVLLSATPSLVIARSRCNRKEPLGQVEQKQKNQGNCKEPPGLALVAGDALGPRFDTRDAPAPSTSPAGCPLHHCTGMPALALVAGEALGPRDALRHRDAPAPSTSPAGCPLHHCKAMPALAFPLEQHLGTFALPLEKP